MKTIIRPTREHSETLKKLRTALETILHTCDSNTIRQCNIEMDEAFATLKRLADERKLVEVIHED